MQKKPHLNPVIAKKNYNNNLQTPTKWVLRNKNFYGFPQKIIKGHNFDKV